jgi:N-acyl-D-amino-acid deacylase
VTRMAIGASQLAGRRQGEVRYYDTNVETSVFADRVGQRCPPPYGAWYLESMDSHGAWVASAIDLARFAAALDDEDGGPLLEADSIAAMFERPPGLAGHDKDGQPLKTCYGAGWQVQHGGDGELTMQMHGGSLPGTSTKLVRRSDGRHFAVLFNARETALTGRLAEDFSGELNRTISEIEAWPDVDYFAE